MVPGHKFFIDNGGPEGYEKMASFTVGINTSATVE
jgi:hypothetical protein